MTRRVSVRGAITIGGQKIRLGLAHAHKAAVVEQDHQAVLEFVLLFPGRAACGTPPLDVGPFIRDMLREQGFPAAGPDASEAEEFTTVLHAVGVAGCTAVSSSPSGLR